MLWSILMPLFLGISIVPVKYLPIFRGGRGRVEMETELCYGWTQWKGWRGVCFSVQKLWDNHIYILHEDED